MTNPEQQLQMIQQALELQQNGDLAGAQQRYEQVLVETPGHPDALHLLGLLTLQQGNSKVAIELIQQAVEQLPEHPVLRSNLGLALHKAGTLVAAAGQLQKAIELKPDFAGAHMNLAAVFSDLGDRENAMEHGVRAVELEPKRAEAWFNLGLFLQDRAELAQAVEAFRRAVTLQPAYREAVFSLLYTLNLIPGLSAGGIDREHRQVAAALYGAPKPRPVQQAGERVHIAYLAVDFQRPEVANTLPLLLAHHDKDRFELTCCHEGELPATLSQEVRDKVDHWVDAGNMDDMALAAHLSQTRTDIIIDMAGHSRGNRLGVLAQRPAPVQLGWFGYPTHPGLEAIDAQLVDERSLIDDQVHGLRPLPGLSFCWQPAPDTVRKNKPPQKSGPLTLGALGPLDRMNDAVLNCWASLLKALPDAKLLMLPDHLDPWHRRRVLGHFAEAGIEPEQVELAPVNPSDENAERSLSNIDILLDTFPWGNRYLACEALSSGIPVVTLDGNSLASKQTGSLLHALGLNDWIGKDETSYRQAVMQLAKDRRQLAESGEALSERFRQSIISDGASFTREFEKAILRALETIA